MRYSSLSSQSWVSVAGPSAGTSLVGVKSMTGQDLSATSTVVTHSLGKTVCGLQVFDEADNRNIVLDWEVDPSAASTQLTIYNPTKYALKATLKIFYQI